MESGSKFTLRGVWLFVSIISLFMPVFIPSFPGGIFPSVIDTSTSLMFLLSFPISAIGLPVFYFMQELMGGDPNSIGGAYLSLIMLFVLGTVQWFWFVPKYFARNSGDEIEPLEFPNEAVPLPLNPMAAQGYDFSQSNEKTPLERVFDDSEE